MRIETKTTFNSSVAVSAWTEMNSVKKGKTRQGKRLKNMNELMQTWIRNSKLLFTFEN